MGVLLSICLFWSEWTVVRIETPHLQAVKSRSLKCASSELRTDLKTFKDKVTGKIQPF